MYNTGEQPLIWQNTHATMNYLGLTLMIIQLALLIGMVGFILANTKDQWMPWVMSVISGYKKRKFNLFKY